MLAIVEVMENLEVMRDPQVRRGGSGVVFWRDSERLWDPPWFWVIGNLPVMENPEVMQA